MIEDRDQGRSETRDSYDIARADDPSIVHENAHLRKEAEIERSAPGRQPTNVERQPFEPELGRTGQLSDRFESSREDDASISHEIPLERDEREDGSQMVKEAGPRNEPRPTPEITQTVDRDSFSRRWAEEMKRAGIDWDKDIEREHDHAFEREHDMEPTRDRER